MKLTTKNFNTAVKRFACAIIATSMVTGISTFASAGNLRGTVSLDGSSTVFPISEAVAEEYRNVEPKVRVTVGVSGTGGGFKKFLASEIDINDASRAIKGKEIAKAKETGVKFIELPIAFDGLSVVISKKNKFIDHLTVAELHEIWKPGSTVNKWNQVRPEWPNKAIRLFGPGTDSGTFDYFTEAINHKSGASRPDYTASEDDNVLVQGVKNNEYALGFFGYAYYIANKSKLTAVPIDGGNGPVAPTFETINTGSYAPLSRPIYIYVNPKSLDRPEVSSFVDFYIKNASALSKEVGYISLPNKVYEAALKRIKKRETGSAYTKEKGFMAPALY